MQGRIDKYVNKTESCWLWEAATNAKGYGICSDGLVHRAVYKLAHGAIPDGKYVLHKCDVRNCCNPDHLYAGTQKDNMRDMCSRGRRSSLLGQPPGERHALAKLKAADVMEIRKLHSDGMKLAAIAEKFPVGMTQIYRIVKNLRWRQLA